MTTPLFCDACGAALLSQSAPCPACCQIQQPPASQHLLQSTELLPGFLLMQRYSIAKKVGEGGFGLVYKAWDRQEKRYVAIKQITLAALSAQEMIEATDSYNREITILPRLHNLHLPEMYDHFTDPEHWYIVMQYIKGQTLEGALGEAHNGRLTVGEVIHFGIQLSDVLGYLHKQEPPIIFRDVKPANVMLSQERIYLIDFGIARRYRPEQTKDTGPLGSPGYAAPEQYGKAQSTTHTDVYGLGATLQTLLTGKEPQEIQATGIPADCAIPPELQTLIAWMMERDPDKRPEFMWGVGMSLRNLQKRYPFRRKQPDVIAPSPFAWLQVLWLLCMLAVPLIPLYFLHASRIYQIILFFEPGMFILILCCILGTTAYYFFKTQYAVSGKLTGKDFWDIAKKGLAGLPGPKLQIFLIGSFFSIWRAIELDNIPLLIALVAYCLIIVAGMLLISSGRLPFLKGAKQSGAASQNQPSEQAMLVQQQVQKHK